MSYLARRRRGLLGLGTLLLALAYANGWRPPGPDRHPDWPAFPHLTNPRLVVAEIPDFARRYRLPEPGLYPGDGAWFEKFYHYTYPQTAAAPCGGATMAPTAV